MVDGPEEFLPPDRWCDTKFCWQYYPEDWWSDPKIRDMSNSEYGIVAKLWNECCLRGSVPDNTKKLSKIIGMRKTELDKKWAKIRPILCTIGDDKLSFYRIEETKKFTDKQSQNGSNAHKNNGSPEISKKTESPNGSAKGSAKIQPLISNLESKDLKPLKTSQGEGVGKVPITPWAYKITDHFMQIVKGQIPEPRRLKLLTTGRDRWAQIFDQINTMDEQPRELIEMVLEFANSNLKWRPIIVNPWRLREKFALLTPDTMGWTFKDKVASKHTNPPKTPDQEKITKARIILWDAWIKQVDSGESFNPQIWIDKAHEILDREDDEIDEISEQILSHIIEDSKERMNHDRAS